MFDRRVPRAVVFLIVLAAAAPAVLAVQAPAGMLPEDFDRLSRGNPAALFERRADVARTFATAFDHGVRLHWGDLSDRPVLVWRPGGAVAYAPAGLAPAEAARRVLLAAPQAWGLSAGEIEALDPAKVFDSDQGVRHVQFVQRVGGIAVFRGHLGMHFDRLGGVIAVGGEWFPGLPAPGNARVEPTTALAVAARGLGLSGAIPEVLESEDSPERKTHFAAGAEYREPPTARLLLAPTGGREAVLVWEVLVQEAVSGWDNLYRVLVDASSGEPLLRERLTLYAGPTGPEDAVGLAFDETPLEGSQISRSFAGDAGPSPSYWVDDGQTESMGPNIRARADLNGTNGFGSVTADGGRRLQFDFPFTNSYELGSGYGGDTNAAITNAFWLGNVIHDYLWHRGFDEPSGNYQFDNFGRGGLGNDPVEVDVQDGATTAFNRNNANWSPTNDGARPRTNYYLWDAPYPKRDGAFDGTVLWHEFGHGVSTRLIGGPSVSCLSGAQGGGMGEGWSDWFAINYYNAPPESSAGPEVVGAYVTGNAALGIRRYPYHVDLAINPLTYADLCDGGSCAVHDEGEIWSAVLWDIRHRLIQTHGYQAGRDAAERLVIDAMKLSPCSPNMVTMRDSILQADELRYAGANRCLLRDAFARRGLGAGAWSVGTGSTAQADFSAATPTSRTLRFEDPSTLGWDAQTGAEGYAVARGSFGAGGATAFDDAGCVGTTADTVWTDGSLPVPGAGLFYVLSYLDGCTGGGYGTKSDGTPRVVAACP